MSSSQTSSIQLKILNTSNPFVATAASRGTIKLNMSIPDSGVLRILRYQAANLSSAGSPIYISFASGALNTSQVINGSNNQTFINSSTEFMLPVNPIVAANGLTNSLYEFCTPIEIMSGDNLTNGSKEINYEVLDVFNKPYGFGALVLTLDFIPSSRYNAEVGSRQVKNKTFTETVSRNQIWEPHSNEHVPRNGTYNY